MFKGLRFFLHYGWKYDKLYIIEKLLSQLISSLTPIALTILPKFIIDELMGAQRPDRLLSYIALLTAGTFLANALSTLLYHDGFYHRLRVDAAFGLDLHARQAQADFVHLEDPAFLDLKKRAEKFLNCDYHGFG